jgi:hypothetical protein
MRFGNFKRDPTGQNGAVDSANVHAIAQG